MNMRENWDRKKIIVDNIFVYVVTLHIVIDNKEPEPKSVEEWRHRVISQNGKKLGKRIKFFK